MPNDDFTIKVSLDFNEKDINKLREDVKKAVNHGSRDAAPVKSSIASRKVSEIESEASASVYKYGTNHIKTKSILSDLTKAKRAEHYENVFSEREKRESIKTEAQQSVLNTRKMREKSLRDKVENKKPPQRMGKMDEMFKHIRSISFSSGKSASGIVNLVSKFGALGVTLGTIAAGAYGVMRLVSWAGNKDIGYASGALGAEGYSAGGIAALSSGVVPGINRDIGQNIAQAISDNAQVLSSSYLPRKANLLGRATQGVAMYKGGMEGIKNLFSLRSDATEKDIYSMIFSDIKGFMARKMPNAAVSLGAQFGLSKEAVLAAQFAPDINQGITKTGETGRWKDFDNLTQAALRQTAAMDNLTGQVNKLAAVITDFVNKGQAATVRHDKFDPIWNHFHFSAPGNSSKGLK